MRSRSAPRSRTLMGVRLPCGRRGGRPRRTWDLSKAQTTVLYVPSTLEGACLDAK